jgi:glycosyltransferase involved in cell wall biosynthesis
MKRRVVVLGSGFEHLMKARGPLLRALAAEGFEVTAFTPPGDPARIQELESWGVRFRALEFRKSSLNPFGDALYFARLVRQIRAVRPDVLLAFTIKAVIYGLLAGLVAGVPRRVAMITGLGYAFTEGDERRRRIARVAAQVGYRTALSAARRVIFQNSDDLELFAKAGLLPHPERAALVSGSGVDTDRFAFSPLPEGPITILMVARLLKDKGVFEFLEAVEIVKAARPDVRFVLAGAADDNPAAVPIAEVEKRVAAGLLDYAGEVLDVRPLLAASHLFVLPSYREGMPLAVLEAMSTGRAIVTTSVPGCRETVEAGRNGRLVPARDGQALAAGILEMIADREILVQAGAASRELCERRFAARVVTAETIRIMFD